MALTIWQEFAQDSLGNAINSPVVTVRKDAVVADIFSDIAGLVPKANPFVGDAKGYMFFYAEAGLYEIEIQTPAGTTTLPNVPIGSGQQHDVGSDPDDLVQQGDLSPQDFSPLLTVSVEAGGDYETWDEFYQAVSLISGDNLVVNADGDFDNSQFQYVFESWDNIEINFAAGSSFSSPVSIQSGSNPRTSISFGPTNTISGELTASVIFISGFNILDGMQFNGITVIDNCVSEPTSTVNIAGTLNIVNTLSPENMGNIICDDEVVTYGSVSAVDVTTGQLTASSGTCNIRDFTNSSSVLVNNLLNASFGATLKVRNIDCGANGVTYATYISQKGTIFHTGSVSGTFTNEYSQVPGLPTQDGIIYADGADKASVSTIENQGLSETQISNSQENMFLPVAFSSLPAANSVAQGTLRRVSGITTELIALQSNGIDKWLTQNGSQELILSSYLARLLGPSGTISIGSSGNWTSGTAFSLTYSEGCFIHLSGAGTTPALPAQLYWVVMSSTTVGTIYSTTWGSGVSGVGIPTIGAAINFTVGGTNTGVTGTDVTMLGMDIIPNLFLPGATLHATSLSCQNGTAGAKIHRVRLGGTTLLNSQATTTMSARLIGEICARLSNVQVGQGAWSVAGTANAPARSTIDMTTTQQLLVTANTSVATDWAGFENITVSLSIKNT